MNTHFLRDEKQMPPSSSLLSSPTHPLHTRCPIFCENPINNCFFHTWLKLPELYVWHTQTNAGVDLWIPLCPLCELCSFQEVMDFKPYCNLQLWFPSQSASLLFNHLQAFSAGIGTVLCKPFDDRLFDEFSHLKSDNVSFLYQILWKVAIKCL